MSANRALLSASEEVNLAKAIERGDRKARERMIECNLRLVFTIARSYRTRGVPYADLVQEGAVGLIQAAERFDHRRGLRFSTYACWWIRRSLLDAIADSQVIRIPVKAKRRLTAICRVEAELRREARGCASDAEIAQRTGLSAMTVRSLRNPARVTSSLDQAAYEDAAPLSALIADTRTAEPSDSAVAAEDRREVATMLRLLPDRHREVLVRRYGLDQGRVQSHEEIGAWLGVGAERTRQIEREALHRLRALNSTSLRGLIATQSPAR